MYNPEIPLLQHQQYHFEHDAGGYLSKYTVIEFDGQTAKKSVWDDHLFDVKIRRNV
jgi:hypothetical protein